MKNRLTYNEYIQLQGLLTLCENYYKKLRDTAKAAEELLELDNVNSHCNLISDAVFGSENFDAKEICKLNKIKILK